MIGKWFRKHVAEKLTGKVIPDTAGAMGKPLRNIAGVTKEGPAQKLPDSDSEAQRRIEQSPSGGSPEGAPGPLPDQRSVYSTAEAAQLTTHAARLPLPFHINTACGQRAEAILSELRHRGVPADALGIARSFVPDLSADGLERAYATGTVMKKQWHATPSFDQRMRAGVGRVDPATRTVEFEGARFTQTEAGRFKITIGPASGGPERSVEAPGEEAAFCNHTAATIRMRTADGQETIGVIDPGYDPTRPLSLPEWAMRQNYPDVVVVSGGLADPPGTPFHVHSELMTETQRARYDAISPDQTSSSYTEDMSRFFNLQPEDSHREELGRNNPDDQYGYSRVLAATILDGNLLPAEIDASGHTAAEISAQLGPVAAYQKWLDSTGGIP